MKKNILPFGIIAIVGIFAAVIIFYVGVHQREDIQQAEDNNGEEVENNDEASGSEEEEIFANNCATCHGDDMSGDVGPDLTKIGADLSEDEIHDLIDNGKGSMPAGIIEGEEADMIAAWLSDHDGESSDDESDDNDSDDNNSDDNADNNADASGDADDIFANNCATCHGDDLSGAVGPDLTKVGGELSEDEIHDIIENGKGSMPAGIVEGDDVDELAKWLGEMK